MEKINLMTKFSIFLVLTILLSSFVFAFGVASSYWKGNPLTIFPGETTTITVRLQNMVGDSDETVRAEITKGNEIASTEKKDYLVKAGTKDTEVPIQITIPSDTQVDTTYQVTITSKTISKQEGGGVAVGVGVDTTFDVLVVPKPKEEKLPTSIAKSLNWIIAVSILIAVVVIYIILKKRKKQA